MNLDEHMVEKIILNSLGALSKSEEQELNNFQQNIEGKEVFAEFNNLVSQFSKLINLSPKKSVPFDRIKEKIFEKINPKKNSELQKDIDSDNDINFNLQHEKFGYIYADSDDWINLSIEGIKFKELAVNKEKGYIMLLMKIAAGAQYPSHHHNGAEECYILEGDLVAEGKTLGPGDFHHAEADSDHEPLYSNNGCTAILVLDAKDF